MPREKPQLVKLAGAGQAPLRISISLVAALVTRLAGAPIAVSIACLAVFVATRIRRWVAW